MNLNGGHPIIFFKDSTDELMFPSWPEFFFSKGSLLYFEKGKMEVRDEDKVMRINSNKYLLDRHLAHGVVVSKERTWSRS